MKADRKKVIDGSNKQKYIGEIGIYLLVNIMISLGHYYCQVTVKPHI